MSRVGKKPIEAIKGVDLVERWLDESQPRTSDRKAWVKRQHYTMVKVWPYLDDGQSW